MLPWMVLHLDCRGRAIDKNATQGVQRSHNLHQGSVSMSSPDELGRITTEARAEIAHRQHLEELGQLAIQSAAAKRAAKERFGRLSKFANQVSRGLTRQTKDRALKEAARQGRNSIFVPVHRYEQRDKRESPEYVRIAEQESATQVLILREKGYDAAMQVHEMPTGLHYTTSGDDVGSEIYEDWLGVDVRWGDAASPTPRLLFDSRPDGASGGSANA
jgi:hypothetical protein